MKIIGWLLSLLLMLASMPAFALWADPPGTASTVPHVIQPSQAGDLVGIRLQNTTGSSIPAGYVTHGTFFLQGTVQPTDLLVARISPNGGGTLTSYFVQMDSKPTWPDGSVRHAALTFNTHASIPPGGFLDVMFAIGAHTGTAIAPSPAAPTATALRGTSYDVAPRFVWNAGGAGTETAHANTCLTNGFSPNWLAGAAVNEFDVVCTVDGGKFKVEYDIRAYADGTTRTDVIFDNTWFQSPTPAKTDVNYNISFAQSGATADSFTASNIQHPLFKRWHHEVKSTGSIDPNVQVDAAYLVATGAVPRWDLSLGVNDNAITAASYPGICRYNCLINNPGLVAPLGIASFSGDMTQGSGRDELGELPDWDAIWLLSGDPRAFYLMMANGDAAGTYPIYLTDENTGRPLNVTCGGGANTYPAFFLGGTFNAPTDCTTYTGQTGPGGSFGATMNLGTVLDTNPGNCFSNCAPAVNRSQLSYSQYHISDPSYLPYVLTVSHYHLLNLQGQAMAVHWNTTNGDISASPSYSTTMGWMSDGNPDNGGNSNQTRQVAEGMRQIAEAVALTPDGDPLKAGLLVEIGRVCNAYQAYVINDDMGAGAIAASDVRGGDSRFVSLGQAKGYFGGITFGANKYVAVPFEEAYFFMGLNTVYRMNISASLNNCAKGLMGYAANWSGGIASGGDMGYNPFNCCSYSNASPTGPNFEAPPFAATFGNWYQNGNRWHFTNWGFVCDDIVNDARVANATGNNYPYPPLDRFVGAANEQYPGTIPPGGSSGCGVSYTFDLIGAYPQTVAAGMSIVMDKWGVSNLLPVRAYAFLMAWTIDAWAQNGQDILNTGGNEGGWRTTPFNLVSPRLSDGKDLWFADINVTRNTTINPPNAGRDTFLGCTGSSGATINGGAGTAEIYLGCPAGDTAINSGTGNNVMLAAWNATGTTTFVDCPAANATCGNNIMYGATLNGSSVGAPTGANVFDFERANSGQDTIWNFRPGKDTLKVKQNLNGNGITTAAGLGAAATVIGKDVVINLGSGNTVTLKRMVTPSNVTTSVQMVP